MKPKKVLGSPGAVWFNRTGGMGCGKYVSECFLYKMFHASAADISLMVLKSIRSS